MLPIIVLAFWNRVWIGVLRTVHLNTSISLTPQYKYSGPTAPRLHSASLTLQFKYSGPTASQYFDIVDTSILLGIVDLTFHLFLLYLLSEMRANKIRITKSEVYLQLTADINKLNEKFANGFTIEFQNTD